MCILIVKPAGVKAPSIDIMQNCWENNPDGAGISYSDGNKLYLKKGFMDWDSFSAMYKKLSIDDHSAIIHFRIATHGTVKPENTHPFNVSDRMIAAHNGILSGIKNEGDMTDSETFFKRICNPILAVHDIESDFFAKVIAATIGTSKLAFLGDDGRVVKFGNFIESNGVFYSNSTYSYSSPYAGYGGYNNYRGYSKSYSRRYGNDHYDDSYYSGRCLPNPKAKVASKPKPVPSFTPLTKEVEDQIIELGGWDMIKEDLELSQREMDISWTEASRLINTALNSAREYIDSSLLYQDVFNIFRKYIRKESITINKVIW